MVGAVARRFAVAYVALGMLGGAAVSSAAVLALSGGSVVSGKLAYTPPPESPFMANLRQVGKVLPQLFLSDYQVAGFGLELAPNGFDNQDPPRPDTLFTFPLPGQSPRSVMAMEFYDGDFVAGHAQSFVRPGLDGRLGDRRVGLRESVRRPARLPRAPRPRRQADAPGRLRAGVRAVRGRGPRHLGADVGARAPPAARRVRGAGRRPRAGAPAARHDRRARRRAEHRRLTAARARAARAESRAGRVGAGPAAGAARAGSRAARAA